MKKEENDHPEDNHSNENYNNESVIDDDFRALEGISDTAKIVDLLAKDKKIERQTILTPKQIRAIAIIKAYADKYDLSVLDVFINSYMELSVSNKGKRAEQIVEIAKANAVIQQLQTENKMLKKVRKE